MEQTRANLADKLGALESQVRETVSGATETVGSAVEGVKEVVGSVSDTVSSVTETFNISKHVEQHP
jgi:archaellum component FlaC